jgi:hypothetical protein
VRGGKSSGPIQKNKYPPGLPPPVARRAPVVCHLRNGAARPSSFDLGDGKGNAGLPPGIKGPKPEHVLDESGAVVAHRPQDCTHPACVATARANRRRHAR